MTEADIFNASTPIEFKGKTYRVRKPNGNERGEYQRWLEKRAYDAIERREYRKGKESQREVDRTNLSVREAAGVFEWGGEACIESLRSQEGGAKFLEIMLHDQGMTLEMAEEWTANKLAEVAAACVSRITNDPKVLGAALNRLGLPADFFTRDSAIPPSSFESTTSEPSPMTSSSESTV